MLHPGQCIYSSNQAIPYVDSWTSRPLRRRDVGIAPPLVCPPPPPTLAEDAAIRAPKCRSIPIRHQAGPWRALA